MPVFPGYLVPTLAHAFHVLMAYRGCRNAYSEVILPCVRDICPGPTSKWLAPFTNGVCGIRHQVLKIVSKSPFFREANKG
jgi:hypothetical protein